MVAGAGRGRKFGVDMDDVHRLQIAHQALTGQDVIQDLRVALEQIGVALGEREHLAQVGQLGALQGRDRRREFEIIQVAQYDHIRRGVQGQDLPDEAVDHLALGHALGLCAEHGRLGATEKGIVAGLGLEMVDDDEDFLAVEEKFSRQGPAGALEAGGRVLDPGRVVGIDAAWAEGQGRAGAGEHGLGGGHGIAARAIDQGHAIGPEEETNANVGARSAAILVVERSNVAVGVSRAASGANGCNQHRIGLAGIDDAVVGGAAVVLDFLQAQNVGAEQVLDDIRGQTGELAG